MYRLIAAAAAVLLPVAAHAQYAAPERPMPSYQDNEPSYSGGYSDSYGTADLHHHVDQTPPPPPVPQGYGYGDYGAGSGPAANPTGWQTPRPYARPDQVDQGSPNDAAHRADRAYTADLNRRAWPGRNAAPTSGRAASQQTGDAGYAGASQEYRAQLAAHQRAMQDYRGAQSDYADRIARWRARADACEGGDLRACGGPE